MRNISMLVLVGAALGLAGCSASTSTEESLSSTSEALDIDITGAPPFTAVPQPQQYPNGPYRIFFGRLDDQGDGKGTGPSGPYWEQRTPSGPSLAGRWTDLSRLQGNNIIAISPDPKDVTDPVLQLQGKFKVRQIPGPPSYASTQRIQLEDLLRFGTPRPVTYEYQRSFPGGRY